jgi:hypothetical protein
LAAASRAVAVPNETLGAIWAGWVDIEIYDLNAVLRLSVAGADQPGSIMELGIADLRQE